MRAVRGRPQLLPVWALPLSCSGVLAMWQPVPPEWGIPETKAEASFLDGPTLLVTHFPSTMSSWFSMGGKHAEGRCQEGSVLGAAGRRPTRTPYTPYLLHQLHPVWPHASSGPVLPSSLWHFPSASLAFPAPSFVSAAPSA